MRSIVRRATPEDYTAFLPRLAKASGIDGGSAARKTLEHRRAHPNSASAKHQPHQIRPPGRRCASSVLELQR